MNNQKSVSENLNENARKLVVIYDEFTESVKTLGSKAKGRSSSKFGGSFAHWVGGEHVVTDRESLCEKFLCFIDMLSRMICFWDHRVG